MSRKSSAKSPTTHTVLIGDPIRMWEKLCWDVDQFQDIQRSYPTEQQPLVFAAINVCIAAWSVEQWAKHAWVSARRSKGHEADTRELFELVRQRVPGQAICRDVANTSKHATHRDAEWKDGEVVLAWEEGDEDTPSTFVLRHGTTSGSGADMAYNTFESVRNDWWKLLVALGMAVGEQYSPDFMQNKLRRIFGSAVKSVGEWPS